MGRVSSGNRTGGKDVQRLGRSSSTQKGGTGGAPKSSVREYTESFLVAGLAALLIKIFIIQAFRIPSGSMEDTLLIGDFLLVNKFVYGAKIPYTDISLPAVRDPKPGDIIVFQYPEDPSKDFIKRCVASEGQTVEIRDKVLYVNGVAQRIPPMGKHVFPEIVPRDMGPRDNWGPQVVPAGHLFMMGDNRDNSQDSRFWGFLDKRLIRGKALIIYMSWESQIGDPELVWTLDAPLTSLFSVVKVAGFVIIHVPWQVRWSRIGHLIE